MAINEIAPSHFAFVIALIRNLEFLLYVPSRNCVPRFLRVHLGENVGDVVDPDLVALVNLILVVVLEQKEEHGYWLLAPITPVLSVDLSNTDLLFLCFDLAKEMKRQLQARSMYDLTIQINSCVLSWPTSRTIQYLDNCEAR